MTAMIMASVPGIANTNWKAPKEKKKILKNLQLIIWNSLFFNVVMIFDSVTFSDK